MNIILKRVMSVILVVVLVFSAAPAAEFAVYGQWLSLQGNAASCSGICGANGSNLTWTLDKETGLLMISGTGEMENYYYNSSPSPWYNDRTSVQTVVMESGVTSIGKFAFYNCKDIVTVTIPDSVTKIGENAFYYCESLTSVTLPNQLTQIESFVFNRCESLRYIEIPDSVTSIDSYAFASCSSLVGVKLSNGLTSIGFGAFTFCKSLKSITIPSRVTSIREYVFSYSERLETISVDKNNTMYSSDESGVLYNKNKTQLVQYPIGNPRTSFTIPSTVESIAENAFETDMHLESITIPSTVTSIGDEAFASCRSLTSVEILNGVTSIEYNTFYFCKKLSSVKLPNSLKTIGDGAFSFCNSLTSIDIPGSVTNIDHHAFSNCSSLVSITIPYGVRSIGDICFQGCTKLKSITFPSSVTIIQGRIFEQCDSLEMISVDAANTVYSSDSSGVLYNKGQTTLIQYPVGCSRTSFSIPDTVTSIAERAFSNCYSLKTVTIPDGMLNIGLGAFMGCRNLTSVIVPSSVENIATNAFSDCQSLEFLHIPSGITKFGINILIGSKAYICSETTECAAKTYADQHGIEFRLCCVHGNEILHTYSTVGTPPTCTTGGFTTHTCTRCGDTYTDNATNALGHDFSEWTVTTAATCTENGEETRECSRCDAKETREITAPGHDYKVVVTEPTCTEGGYTTHTCSVCGDTFTADRVNALGHAWNDGEVTTEPTCTEAGVKTFTCRNDSSHTKTESIPTKGHSFGAWKQTTAPTVYAEGAETQYCANCTATNTRSIPKLPMPKVNIRNFTTSSKAYDYRSTITFKAYVDNKLPGGQIHWFVVGKEVGTGDTYTAANVKQSFSLQAKYYVDGKEIPEAATDVETVNVNTGFFAKLKAFFRSLFGLLPKVTQEYLGIEFIDCILPD